MPLTLNVAKADLNLESAYAQPEFGLFRDTSGLIGRLFTRLQPHGLRLRDVRIDRGGESVADFHVACHLYNFRVGVLVRTEKVEIGCLNVEEQDVDQFGSVAVEALSAVKEYQPALVFRSHAMGVAMHGTLESASVKDYLSQFAKNLPGGLGPQTGNGGVIYFGADDDRILSSVTFDISGLLPESLFVRTYAVWDARKVEPSALPARAKTFVRQALDAFGLEVPTLRS